MAVDHEEADDELAVQTEAFAGYESSEEDFPTGITRNTVGNIPLEWSETFTLFLDRVFKKIISFFVLLQVRRISSHRL